MSKWQPIETAPKDGTTVLLFDEKYDGVCAGKFKDGAWYANGVEKEQMYYAELTHWQPVPAYPK